MANLTHEIHGDDASSPGIAGVDRKLEVTVIPVLDIDRAKEFYKKLRYAECMVHAQTGEELPQ